MSNQGGQVTVAALYQFHSWPKSIEEVKADLHRFCSERQIVGTLLVAEEGVNGTISGSTQAVRELRDRLIDVYGFQNLEYKESYANEEPFLRLKVKLKKEIVTLGRPEADPTKQCGTYVDPREWNDLLKNPDVVIIDTRNDYEYEIGTFEGAINPHTKTFREFPAFIESQNLDKKKPIVTYCTGGIRCEKATSYLKAAGFENVYHLKGGILKYLEEVPESESLWKGDCFVFDKRVGVGHGLSLSDYKTCYGCRSPLTKEDFDHPHYEAGVSCKRCYEETTDTDKARFRERHKQEQLAHARNARHIGR